MELRILGPEVAVADDSGAPIKVRRQVRALLCVLAASAGTVVSTATLVEFLWENGADDPDPAGRLKQLVYSARRVVPEGRLLSGAGGYHLELGGGDRLDLREFEQLIDQARGAVRDQPVTAARLYLQAIELWGSPPLGDLRELQTTGAAKLRRVLMGRLLDACEEVADVLLSERRYQEVVSRAPAWLETHPFAEFLRGRVMLAYAGLGRSREAMRIYQQGVEVMPAGATPGRWLTDIAQQVASAHTVNWSPRPVHLASQGTGFDPSRPSGARIYDYLLGGKDNFAADRAAGDRMMEVYPHSMLVARQNRGFVIRAVTYLAREAGIRQFLDLGTGLPTQQNVHQVAHAVSPDARVVYVDRDPVVCAHGRALLTTAEGVEFLQADVRHPTGILEHPRTRALIDFSRPLAIILATVVHFIPDSDRPQQVVEEYKRALPAGGYLALSHCTVPATVTRSASEVAEGEWRRSTTPITPRPPEVIGRFFDGLSLVEPGMVDAPLWRPDLAAGEVEPPVGTWRVGVASAK